MTYAYVVGVILSRERIVNVSELRTSQRKIAAYWGFVEESTSEPSQSTSKFICHLDDWSSECCKLHGKRDATRVSVVRRKMGRPWLRYNQTTGSWGACTRFPRRVDHLISAPRLSSSCIFTAQRARLKRIDHGERRYLHSMLHVLFWAHLDRHLRGTGPTLLVTSRRLCCTRTTTARLRT